MIGKNYTYLIYYFNDNHSTIPNLKNIYIDFFKL